MLLDTGADVSLLPSSSVKTSDLAAASSNTYRLVGFDGSSHLFQSIELQIVFIRKRFTGKFCLIDDEIGILGRDVLNQLSIIFDGPNLEWDILNSSVPEID